MYPKSLEQLIECFRRLPGVGEKTAERYALLLTESDQDEINQFARALVDVSTKLHHCKICGNLAEDELCDICKDKSRDQQTILVVASSKDVFALEKSNQFDGVYHVLNGLISSSKGIMPDDLNMHTLIERAKDASEVILATSATLDGETTALYLEKVLKKECPDLLVTRIAHGLPSGGLLDYADEMTLMHALQDRKKL